MDNWTSPRRHIAEDSLPPYEAVALADFVYKDEDGVLTALLFDAQVAEQWSGSYPTYYIEVKTTSGEKTAPFFMQKSQIRTVSSILPLSLVGNSLSPQALNLTNRDSDETPPTNIYVLARVWKMPSKPSHIFVVDPHRHVYDGDLRVFSDKVELMLQ